MSRAAGSITGFCIVSSSVARLVLTP
jgi:hypothetical protein